MILIKNAKINTISNGIIDDGYILIDNGKIKEVGEKINLLYNSNIDVIDCKGNLVTPGLIEAHCHLGLYGDTSSLENNDYNESSEVITPEVSAIDSINPFSSSIEEARKSGVTTVAAGPGSANVIGGQFVAFKTYGKRIDNMIIKAPVAMKAALGENPKRSHGGKGRAPLTRMGSAALMREALFKAKEYLSKKDLAGDDISKKPAFNMKYEALIPVLKGEIPMKIHVHRADDIFTAIRIAKEFNLSITLDHCTDGALIAEEIKAEGFNAIVGPSFTHKTKLELANKGFKTAKILSEAGIKIAITTDSPVVPIEYLQLMAILAVKEGLSKEEALRSITLNAAEILNINNRVGSIEVGKDADIVIWSGDIFDALSKVKYTIINGEVVYKS